MLVKRKTIQRVSLTNHPNGVLEKCNQMNVRALQWVQVHPAQAGRVRSPAVEQKAMQSETRARAANHTLQLYLRMAAPGDE